MPRKLLRASELEICRYACSVTAVRRVRTSRSQRPRAVYVLSVRRLHSSEAMALGQTTRMRAGMSSQTMRGRAVAGLRVMMTSAALQRVWEYGMCQLSQRRTPAAEV